MLGLMQDWPLLVHKIIDHAALYHGDREVVTRSVEGPIERTNYRAVAVRARKVAAALDARAIKLGDRVATLAWNTARHLEAWYGIAGIGAVDDRTRLNLVRSPARRETRAHLNHALGQGSGPAGTRRRHA